MSGHSQASPKRYFSSGLFILGLLALLAAGYFVFVAQSSKLEGVVLISGFAAIGMSVLWRNLQHYSERPTEPVSNDPRRKSLIGRSSFGGPGKPRPLFHTLLLIQGVVIALFVATGIDREAIVIASFFATEDITLMAITSRMKTAATTGAGKQD